MSNENDKNRNLYLFEVVERNSVKGLIEDIHKFNDEDDKEEAKTIDFKRSPIKLHINTPGGSVYNGLGLIDTIINSKTPIHTIVGGLAASMGVFIASVGHERYAHKHSTFMYHEIARGTYGKLTDIEIDVNEAKRLSKVAIGILLEYTQFTESIEDVKTDLYFTSEEALNKYGMIDYII